MSKRDIQIKIMVTPEENEQIRKNAKACDRTTSAYMREMAMNMCVYQHNYHTIEKHTKEISVIRNAIVQMTYTIFATSKYFPADLEYIYSRLKEIFAKEKQLLEYDLESHDLLRKELREAVRSIVDQHLAKMGIE